MNGRELFLEDELPDAMKVFQDEVNVGDSYFVAIVTFPSAAAVHLATVRFTRLYALALTGPLLYAALSVGGGMSQARALPARWILV